METPPIFKSCTYGTSSVCITLKAQRYRLHLAISYYLDLEFTKWHKTYNAAFKQLILAFLSATLSVVCLFVVCFCIDYAFWWYSVFKTQQACTECFLWDRHMLGSGTRRWQKETLPILEEQAAGQAGKRGTEGPGSGQHGAVQKGSIRYSRNLQTMPATAFLPGKLTSVVLYGPLAVCGEHAWVFS